MKVNYHTTFNQASIRTIYIRQYVLFYKIVQLIICTIAVGQKVSITFFWVPSLHHITSESLVSQLRSYVLFFALRFPTTMGKKSGSVLL